VSLDADMIALIDQRVRSLGQTTRAAGTCVDRDTTGPGGQVVFDGSTVAMPVKVLGHVYVQPGFRCVLDKYGSDWVVTGSFAGQGLGELNRVVFGSTNTTTSSTFIDFTDMGPSTFTKGYDLTLVRMAITAACFVTVAGNTSARFGMRLTPQDPGSTYTAQDYTLPLLFHNNVSSHQSAYYTIRALSIPAGAYTVQMRWRRSGGTGTINVDGNDVFVLEMDERVRYTVPIL
jgi:hypothetical protein